MRYGRERGEVERQKGIRSKWRTENLTLSEKCSEVTRGDGWPDHHLWLAYDPTLHHCLFLLACEL